MDSEPQGVAALLDESRIGVRRLTPKEAMAAVERGAMLVDTRTEAQRREQGELSGALVIDRTVLEWRLDPASGARIPEASHDGIQVIAVCRQGYSSSLVAASLRSLGLWRATDVVGGVEAWRAAGLPLHRGLPTFGVDRPAGRRLSTRFPRGVNEPRFVGPSAVVAWAPKTGSRQELGTVAVQCVGPATCATSAFIPGRNVRPIAGPVSIRRAAH